MSGGTKDSLNKEHTSGEILDSTAILKAMQQQFGRIQLVLGNMEERMDRYEERLNDAPRNERRRNQQIPIPPHSDHVRNEEESEDTYDG